MSILTKEEKKMRRDSLQHDRQSLLDLFNQDGNWCPTSLGEARYRGIAPNAIYHEARRQIAFLVAFHSAQSVNRWGVTEGGFRYITESVLEKRIKSGFVALVAKDASRIEAWKTIAEASAIFADMPLKKGRWGTYWWVDQNFMRCN